MRGILIGIIVGAILAIVSVWMLGYLSAKGGAESSTDFDTLKREFPNKTLIYWTEEASTEIYLYGRIALIRNQKTGSPRKEMGFDEARAIWNQFERLPGLEDYKNSDPDSARLRSTHSNVFVNDSAGAHFSPQRSYSIPKNEEREEYRVWRNLIEATVCKHLGEQAAALNGP